MRMRRMRGLTADPDFAALEVLFLPNWHNFLQSVDRETARLERLSTMGRRNRDGDRGLSDFYYTDTMRDRDASDFPSAAGFIRELANLRERHRLVGLVFEAQHLAADVVLAGGADEGA